MTVTLHDKQFPGETSEYRAARNALLQAELELRDKIERVAALRRQLPNSAPVSEDYVFDVATTTSDANISQLSLSQLFENGKNTLVLINYMFAPGAQSPCTMCTMWADTYDAAAPHLEQQINFALVARCDIETLQQLAISRGWQHIQLLSSQNNTFNADYLTQIENRQQPSITVFKKDHAGTIWHFYSIEAHFVSSPGDPRHLDLCSPVWNLLDLTPTGRGKNWYPQLSYRRSQ